MLCQLHEREVDQLLPLQFMYCGDVGGECSTLVSEGAVVHWTQGDEALNTPESFWSRDEHMSTIMKEH